MNGKHLPRRSPLGRFGVLAAASVWIACAGAGVARAEDEPELGPPPSLLAPAPTPAPGFASGPSTPQVFTARDGRELLLMVPAAWEAKGGPGPQGSISAVVTPRIGRTFSLQITAIPLTPAEAGRLQGDGLRHLVQGEGERMLGQSRETAIRLESVLGAFGRGYLYTVTDSQPVLRPGEWRYLTAGAYLVGGTLLSVSLLSNEGVGAVKMQALDVLRSGQVQAAF